MPDSEITRLQAELAALKASAQADANTWATKLDAVEKELERLRGFIRQVADSRCVWRAAAQKCLSKES